MTRKNNMTIECKGICQKYEAPKIRPQLRYKTGQKKCVICERFFITDKWRCICCNTKLRNRSHSYKKKIK